MISRPIYGNIHPNALYQSPYVPAKACEDTVIKPPAEVPDHNPKTRFGIAKVPLHLVPPSAKHFLALALADGAVKYGPYNWRDTAISTSVYVAAAQRHLDAFWDGEDNAPDSGVHHIAHAMACMALMLDALTIDKLNDDRPTKGAAPMLQLDYASVKRDV
jgi:hypothetical protein